jgi:hypothetical protein
VLALPVNHDIDGARLAVVAHELAARTTRGIVRGAAIFAAATTSNAQQQPEARGDQALKRVPSDSYCELII